MKLEPRLAGDRITGQRIQRGVVRIAGRGHSGDGEGEGSGGEGPGGGEADGTIVGGAPAGIAGDHAAPAAGHGGSRLDRSIDVANRHHGTRGGAASRCCRRHGDAGHVDPVIGSDGDGHPCGTGETTFIVHNDESGRVRADGRIRMDGIGFSGVGGAVSESPIILNNGAIGVRRARAGELYRQRAAAGDRCRLGRDGGGQLIADDGDGHLSGARETAIIENHERSGVGADSGIRVNGVGFSGADGAVPEIPIILRDGAIGIRRADAGELHSERAAAGDWGRLSGDGGGRLVAAADHGTGQ